MQGQETYFFPLNYVLFIWQEHMPTASPQTFLIYYYGMETKTILFINHRQYCFLEHADVKQ